jgi:hypothetical protein
VWCGHDLEGVRRGVVWCGHAFQGARCGVVASGFHKIWCGGVCSQNFRRVEFGIVMSGFGDL